MKICIIPARGGSKRIPGKNSKIFEGRPIIYWSIKAAKESNIFDKIMVSTDSEKIANLSKEYGAEVPFLRNERLAGDYTGTHEVVKDFIIRLEDRGMNIKHACCLYATSPLVEKEDISKTYELLISKRAETYAFVATEYGYPIQRSFTVDSDGKARAYSKKDMNKRSQDLTKMYHDAGQFYWAKTEVWKSKEDMIVDSIPYIIPSWRVQDIDTIEDWKRAELLFRLLYK